MANTNLLASEQLEESQLVTFYLGNEEFGFDIMSVQEIIRQPALSRIPMAPEYVEGIANLRGTVLPIIDTRTRFGMKREEDTDRTRVLVVDVDGVKTGLRVDRVRQVTRINRGDIEASPAVIKNGMSTDYLQGVVKLEQGKRIIMSLSPAAICKIESDGAMQHAIASTHSDLASGNESKLTKAGESSDQSLAQLVSFKLGDEEFAFPMERVREILRVQRPNEVPDTPKHFLGILTVRGNILPVIDLRLLLNLRDMAGDVESLAEHARDDYERWLTAMPSYVEESGNHLALVQGAEALRSWIAAFATSSELLMGTLGAIRLANDKVLRAIQHLQTCNTAEVRLAHFKQQIEPHAQEALRQLLTFKQQVRECIREDQRLIVVQTGGALLALLVDQVKEVLTVPTRLIDPPPQLGKEKNREIQGVARLNDGKRLIMLLDSDHLVEGQTKEALKKAGAVGAEVKAAGIDMKHAQESASALGERQFVTFQLADGEYGIPINEIQEIDRSSRMTKIPKSAEHVDGITNLRGEVVPVINARKRFNLPVKESDERTRVIIIDVGGKKTGLLVDSVREVLNLATKDIAQPPATISSTIDQQYISGIGKVDSGKRMIVLLNVNKVVES
jgi:purine-binding chemotaxis protein CheW